MRSSISASTWKLIIMNTLSLLPRQLWNVFIAVKRDTPSGPVRLAQGGHSVAAARSGQDGARERPSPDGTVSGQSVQDSGNEGFIWDTDSDEICGEDEVGESEVSRENEEKQVKMVCVRQQRLIRQVSFVKQSGETSNVCNGMNRLRKLRWWRRRQHGILLYVNVGIKQKMCVVRQKNKQTDSRQTDR